MITKEQQKNILKKIEEERLREIAAAMTDEEAEIFIEVWSERGLLTPKKGGSLI